MPTSSCVESITTAPFFFSLKADLGNKASLFVSVQGFFLVLLELFFFKEGGWARAGKFWRIFLLLYAHTKERELGGMKNDKRCGRERREGQRERERERENFFFLL